VRDYHLDRRGVEARRRAKLTRTNPESHVGILYLILVFFMYWVFVPIGNRAALIGRLCCRGLRTFVLKKVGAVFFFELFILRSPN
jgi:hypothetical protein